MEGERGGGEDGERKGVMERERGGGNDGEREEEGMMEGMMERRGGREGKGEGGDEEGRIGRGGGGVIREEGEGRGR